MKKYILALKEKRFLILTLFVLFGLPFAMLEYIYQRTRQNV